MKFQPTPGAKRFVIEGGEGQLYDAYTDVIRHADGYLYVDTRYRVQGASGDKWTFLCAFDFKEDELYDDPNDTDKRLLVILEKTNVRISEVFGKQVDSVPVAFEERVRWAVRFGLTETENALSLKLPKRN